MLLTHTCFITATQSVKSWELHTIPTIDTLIYK